jgi:hypothetical protein
MDQERMDQGWQQLQARIERMLDPYRTAGMHNTEYKPRQTTRRLETAADKKVMAASDTP